MESVASGLAIVTNRLEKLERQNRAMKQLGAAVMLFFSSIFLMGQAAPKKTIEANEFVLKDSMGRMRASFSSIEPSGTVLTFQGTDGKPRLTMSVAHDAPNIEMYDPQGVHIIYLGAAPSEAGLLIGKGFVAGKQVGGHAALQMVGAGTSLELFDEDGFHSTIGNADPRNGGLRKTSAASVVLSDKNKNVLWKAP